MDKTSLLPGRQVGSHLWQFHRYLVTAGHFTLKIVNVVESHNGIARMVARLLVVIKQRGILLTNRRHLSRSLYLLLLLAMMSCGVLPTGAPPTLTPPAAPTPEGGTIFFDAPYVARLPPNTLIPRTRILYSTQQDDIYVFFVDGLITYKRSGDSLTWQGVIAPNVAADYRLVLGTDTVGQILANGTVRVAVFNPTPVEVPLSGLPSTPPDFIDIPISYVVPENHRVPGTALTYTGREGDQARLSGGQGYPLFPLGNSVTWSGQLAPNVLLRYDLVVSRLDDYGLGLSGTARLWVTN